MILNDRQIVEMGEAGAIVPFEAAQVRTGAYDGQRRISYGTSSFGYDLRLSPEDFRIFSPIQANEIDPKAFNDDALVSAWPREGGLSGPHFLMPPHTYALGLTVETFSFPPDVLGLCVGKSTYARAGLFVNTTPLEPGWKGRLVIELYNAAALPLRVYVNEGIAQCVFLKGETPATTYEDRGGKYQGQNGLWVARV